MCIYIYILVYAYTSLNPEAEYSEAEATHSNNCTEQVSHHY